MNTSIRKPDGTVCGRRNDPRIDALVKEFEAWAKTAERPFVLVWCKLVWREKGYKNPKALQSSLRNRGIVGRRRYFKTDPKYIPTPLIKADAPRREKLMQKYGFKEPMSENKPIHSVTRCP